MAADVPGPSEAQNWLTVWREEAFQVSCVLVLE